MSSITATSSSSSSFSNPYFSPTKQKTNRKPIDWSVAKSAAYVPTALIYYPTHLKPKQLSPVHHRELEQFHNRPLKDVLINMLEFPSESLYKQLKDDIKDHVERRIQLFFQQILLTWKSNKEFEIAETDLQIGSGAKNKNAPRAQTEEARSCYAAAHSSTITNLKFKMGAGDGQLAYPSASQLRSTWNITVLLPSEVNYVDSLLDGTTKSLKLRNTALKILNEIAIPNTLSNPKAALQEFLAAMRIQIQASKQHIESSQETQLRNLWTKKAKEIPYAEWLTQPQGKIELDKIVKKIDAKKLVIGWYDQVAETYEERLSEEEDFLKIISFGLTNDNASHLTEAQKSVQEMALKDIDDKPLSQYEVAAPRTSRRLQGLAPIAPVVNNQLTALQPTAKIYKDWCSTSQNIRDLVTKYFAQVLSYQNLELGIKEAIKAQFNKKSIHHVDLIVQHLIAELRPFRVIIIDDN